MPSGAKRRKAAKKKMQKGEALNLNNNNSDNISLTHSQGSDDVKSIDERESDGDEVEREEEEKGEVVREEGAVDRVEESGGSMGQRPEEESVEVERESKPKDGIPIGSGNSISVDVGKEVKNGDRTTCEDKVPSNGSPEEKEVTFEREEKPVTAQSGEESKGQEDYGSLLEKGSVDETPKPADYLPEEAIGAKGAIVDQVYKLVVEQVPIIESVKEVVSSPQQANLTTHITLGKGSAKSESVVSDLKSNEEVLPMSDGNEKTSPAVVDSQLGKIETKVVSVEDDSIDRPSSNGKEKDDSIDRPSGNGKENEGKLPEYLGVPAVDASSGGVDDIKELISHHKSEEMAVAPAVEAGRDVEYVKNGETVKHSDDQVSASVVKTSCGVDDGKDSDNSKHLEDQRLIGSTPTPVRRTSWMGCCGLFEVFSGSC